MQNAVLLPNENPPGLRQLDNLYVVVGKLLMSLSGEVGRVGVWGRSRCQKRKGQVLLALQPCSLKSLRCDRQQKDVQSYAGFYHPSRFTSSAFSV